VVRNEAARVLVEQPLVSGAEVGCLWQRNHGRCRLGSATPSSGSDLFEAIGVRL